MSDLIKALADNLTYRQIVYCNIRAKVLTKIEVVWLKIRGKI